MAALTVLRAYHVAGRPAQATRLGSFGKWSDLVRSALMWLGLYVSRSALAILLDDDARALAAYLAGDRSSPVVRPYLDRT